MEQFQANDGQIAKSACTQNLSFHFRSDGGSTVGWKYERERCRQVRGDSANDRLFKAGLANQPDVSLRQSEWFMTASKL